MQTVAAVQLEPGGDLELLEVQLDDPRADEVLVRLEYTGICHSDISALAGMYGLPTPLIVGHEGSGIVEAIGSGVMNCRVGQRVVLSFASCGRCDRCLSGHPVHCRQGRAMNMTGYRADGTSAYRLGDGRQAFGHFVGQSTFARHALVSSTCVVGLPDGAPSALMAPLGCGIQTGAGTIDYLAPAPGSTAAVVGTGAVGLAAVMMAADRGCSHIVAIDTRPERLDVARKVGATHTIVVQPGTDLVGSIREVLDGRGLELALDTSAVPHIVPSLLEAVDELGRVALVGSYPSGTKLEIDARTLLRGRRVEGALEGDRDPIEFIPRLVDMYRAGRLPLEDIVVQAGRLEDINEILERVRAGELIKPVVSLGA